MLELIVLAAGAADLDIEKVPVEHSIVNSSEYRISPSDSVRAATWDDLSPKPAQPARVRVACLVSLYAGVPGACVPASRLPAGATVNWATVRNDYENGERAAEAEAALVAIAEKRLSTARLFPGEGWRVRIFEEVISPSDARPAFAFTDTLNLRDVTLTQPLDGTLLQALYPSAPLRQGASASVTVMCKIERSLRLLCRDRGLVQVNVIGDGRPEDFVEGFRWATYQIASTITLQPKTRIGDDIVGKNLRFTLRWALPED